MVLIFILAVCVVGLGLYIYNPEPTKYGEDEGETVFCTQDAKLCPDGSYVGRSGPNCEFSPCPIPSGVQMEDGTLPAGSTTTPSGGLEAI